MVAPIATDNLLIVFGFRWDNQLLLYGAYGVLQSAGGLQVSNKVMCDLYGGPWPFFRIWTPDYDSGA